MAAARDFVCGCSVTAHRLPHFARGVTPSFISDQCASRKRHVHEGGNASVLGWHTWTACAVLCGHTFPHVLPPYCIVQILGKCTYAQLIASFLRGQPGNWVILETIQGSVTHLRTCVEIIDLIFSQIYARRSLN